MDKERTAGEIALEALAKLDAVTMISKEKWKGNKVPRQIRLIINSALNDIKKVRFEPPVKTITTAIPPEAYNLKPIKYMVMAVRASGCVFVKEKDFFVSQGGNKEEWGKAWVEVEATSIEHARELGCEMFPYAKPYEQQAKP
jgi:hypothetical protein